MAKIRCKECRVVADESEEYCPECGAIFMPPFTYIDEEKKAVESIKVKQKSQEEMSLEEKLHNLNENYLTVHDELVKLRYEINQKADECMRCFTAAGLGRAKDFDEEMSNIYYKRTENLEESDMLLAEYRGLLSKLKIELDNLVKAREELIEFKTANNLK